MELVGQVLINALYQCKVALGDAVGIVAGKSDLHRAVDVVPVGVMVLLLAQSATWLMNCQAALKSVN